jgi:hypothetical protein
MRPRFVSKRFIEAFSCFFVLFLTIFSADLGYSRDVSPACLWAL